MKTFVIKSAAAGIGSGQVQTVQTSGGVIVPGSRIETVRLPITQEDIQRFKNEVPVLKQKFYKAFKPMLERGGFIFDPTLWKW